MAKRFAERIAVHLILLLKWFGRVVFLPEGNGTEAKHSAPVGFDLLQDLPQIAETAQGFQEEGHGLFTYYLLKELKDTQGMVSYGKLVDNIEKNVSNVAPTLDLRKKQTPRAFTSYPDNSWRKYSF